MLAAGKQKSPVAICIQQQGKKSIANSFPFLSSGLYRRPRIHTGSTAVMQLVAGLRPSGRLPPVGNFTPP